MRHLTQAFEQERYNGMGAFGKNKGDMDRGRDIK